MNHTCHAIGCNVKVPPVMFMCKHHWFSLPFSFRIRIWKYYRPGQCDDWHISNEYADAAKGCLIFLAKKEGKPIADNEPKLKLYDLWRPGAIQNPPKTP